MTLQREEKSAMEVTVIKAKAKVKKILKVAAYCRVSVEQDEQESSIANQKAYYEELIRKNPDYMLAGIYYDNAHVVDIVYISGKRRPEPSTLSTARRKIRLKESAAKGLVYHRRLWSPGGRSRRIFSFLSIRISRSRISIAS